MKHKPELYPILEKLYWLKGYTDNPLLLEFIKTDNKIVDYVKSINDKILEAIKIVENQNNVE